MKSKCSAVLIFCFLCNFCFAQAEKIRIETDKLKPFEAAFFDAANLVKPGKVKRYFNTESGASGNFQSVAVYAATEGLIAGEYVFYEVSFFGNEHSFNISFHYSAGTAYTCRGTFVVEGSEQLLTEYQYGTSAGTVQLKRNGKLAYAKDTEL